MTNEELLTLRADIYAHADNIMVGVPRETALLIIDELLKLRNSEAAKLHAQLQVARELCDALRRQSDHYRDRHPHPFGACPECRDK